MANRNSYLIRSCEASGRTLYAFDWENLLGGATTTPEEASTFFHVLSVHTNTMTARDRVVVAMSHRMAKRSWFALPGQGIQRVIGSGQNGADLALLNAIDINHDSRRFSRLVIGSGDGIFTELATAAARSGMVVGQVVGRGRSARSLSAVCTRTAQLPFDVACGHGLALAA